MLMSRRLTVLLVAAVSITAILSMGAGAVFIEPLVVLKRCFGALTGNYIGDSVDLILFGTRLPRIILAAAVGSALATSGVAAQTLFRNPLASPYIIGVSNGAALGAVAAMLLLNGAFAFSFAAIPLFSIAAGLAVTMLVFLLGRRSESLGNGLLLSGIAIGAFCASITSAALYLADERLQTLVFWMMGGFWRADARAVKIMLPVSLAGIAVLMSAAKAMNIALMGERTAGDLGVNVARLQKILLAVIAVQTAVAVSISGVIGFVGLIVPHLIRGLSGPDHNRLVPAAACGGAVLLMLADALARTVAAPAELPVGIITSLIGGPVFLWLLHRRPQRSVL
jgi:iron complex transport system permease protein